MELKKIASFQVDHTKMPRGLYLSRVDGDIATYDLRMKLPNAGDYLANPAMHTIEHLFATWARSSAYGPAVVYVGPMGCRTGFYLLTRGLSHAAAIELCRGAFAFIASFEGPVPGVSAVECGNWLEHDLPGARAEAAAYLPVLRAATEAGLAYPS
jgi:S-ribosylhomocysteine lyase